LRFSRFRRLPLLALLTLGLAGCASATSGGDNTSASAAPQRWNQDRLIQQNQLLPNGLRPFRYFYW
jgi:hypothetical protein